MNCKHCQAPLEDGNPLCPSCGWDNSQPEETEAPIPQPEQAPETEPEIPAAEPESPAAEPASASASTPEVQPVNKKKLALIIGGVVLVLAIAAGIIWALTRNQKSVEDPGTSSPTGSETLAPEETAEPTGVLTREDYAFTGEDITPELDKVVSTMEDATLTNGMLQIFYWRSFYDFLSSYSNYISYMGLDTTQPLGEQTCSMSTTPMTWEQFFLDNALKTWAQYQSVYNDAKKAGFTVSEEVQTQLDGTAEQLAVSAQQYGFDSAQAMLEADFGPGITVETYQAYLELYMTSMEYYYSQMDAMAPSEAEVEAYFQENLELFTQNGITQDETPATINVRHILIQPEGEKEGTDESGTAVYSEEQLAAAKAEAQEIYDQWLAGEATEESFAALVADNSDDPGSSSNGGLYESVAPGQMVTEFNDWCFDPARKAGDTALVVSPFGCHIMYFVSASEKTYWYATAENEYLSEKSTQFLQGSLDAHPYEVNYDVITIAPVELGSAY